MVQLGWQGLQCQLIGLSVSISFVLIDTIDSVDRINRINPEILNCSVLQLKDNANDPTNSGVNCWGKKGNFLI